MFLTAPSTRATAGRPGGGDPSRLGPPNSASPSRVGESAPAAPKPLPVHAPAATPASPRRNTARRRGTSPGTRCYRTPRQGVHARRGRCRLRPRDPRDATAAPRRPDGSWARRARRGRVRAYRHRQGGRHRRDPGAPPRRWGAANAATAALDAFVALDRRMKDTVTAWQLRDVDGQQVINDRTPTRRTTPGWWPILAALHVDAARWLAPLVPSLPRLAGYLPAASTGRTPPSRPATAGSSRHPGSTAITALVRAAPGPHPPRRPDAGGRGRGGPSVTAIAAPQPARSRGRHGLPGRRVIVTGASSGLGAHASATSPAGGRRRSPRRGGRTGWSARGRAGRRPRTGRRAAKPT